MAERAGAGRVEAGRVGAGRVGLDGPGGGGQGGAALAGGGGRSRGKNPANSREKSGAITFYLLKLIMHHFSHYGHRINDVIMMK